MTRKEQQRVLDICEEIRSLLFRSSFATGAAFIGGPVGTGENRQHLTLEQRKAVNQELAQRIKGWAESWVVPEVEKLEILAGLNRRELNKAIDRAAASGLRS